MNINGTGSDDTIVVTFTSSDTGSYTLNGGMPVAFAGITFLTISSGVGNDTVSVTGGGVPVNYNGGSGNDEFTGGAASNSIDGGIGADRLTGGNQTDFFRVLSASHAAVGERIDGRGGADWLEVFAPQTYNFSGVTINRIEQLGFGTAVGQTTTVIFLGTQLGAGKISTIAGSGGTEKLIVNAAGNTDLAPLIFSGWGAGNTITINGGNASQSLKGSSQIDTLNGLGGNDTLIGNGGNDNLIGGPGKDTQTGGLGNDFFKFLMTTHSSANPALSDIVMDFDDPGKGNDTIDVSALFGPKLIYRHAGAFTAAGQLRINDIAGADVLVEVNTGGTLAADFALRLKATTLASMTASDFVL